jgi:hypothetical protein
MKTAATRGLLVLALTAFPTQGFAEPFLVEDGERHAEIVIAEEPARAAEFGASELQTYLEQISGCRLEIVTTPTDAVPVKIYVR